MLATKERCPAVEPSTGKLVRRHNEEKKKERALPYISSLLLARLTHSTQEAYAKLAWNKVMLFSGSLDH